MNSTLHSATQKSMHEVAAAYVATQAAPGVAVCLVRDRSVASQFYAGFADIERAEEVSAGHRYEIGSISKSFTSLVVLTLVDEGVIALSDTVQQHLPWFEVQSDYEPITLRHLLDHSSGLIMGSDSWPDEAAQVWALRSSSTGSAPGTIFHYSNVGFMTLGAVVEAVTGRTCTDLMRERVVEVVGMPDTITTITDNDRHTMAVGYQPRHEDRAWCPGDPLAPATWFEVSAADGNVASTAADMGRYLAMLLGRGQVDGRRVISEGAFTSMITPTSPGGEPAPGPSQYALGINVEQISDRTCITHGGGMVGYSTFLIGDLELGCGVIVLTNAPGDSPGAQWLARALFDALCADSQGSPLPVAPAYVPPPRPVLPEGNDGSVSGDLAAYVGHYRSFNPWFSHLRIAAVDGRLVLVAPNGVEAPGIVDLVEISPGVFREGTDPRLPERLYMGPVVEGRALWVARHDCRYSRTFRP
ncbi:MAG: serine hydrolase domain-containing protein [Actinomycetes bacterium]